MQHPSKHQQELQLFDQDVALLSDLCRSLAVFAGVRNVQSPAGTPGEEDGEKKASGSPAQKAALREFLDAQQWELFNNVCLGRCIR